MSQSGRYRLYRHLIAQVVAHRLLTQRSYMPAKTVEFRKSATANMMV
jgi:hypothetical protein